MTFGSNFIFRGTDHAGHLYLRNGNSNSVSKDVFTYSNIVTHPVYCSAHLEQPSSVAYGKNNNVIVVIVGVIS